MAELAEGLQGVQRGWRKLRGAEASIELAERLGHRLVIIVRLVRPLGAAAEVAADGRPSPRARLPAGN